MVCWVLFKLIIALLKVLILGALIIAIGSVAYLNFKTDLPDIPNKDSVEKLINSLTE